jgi:hypothetical protein
MKDSTIEAVVKAYRNLNDPNWRPFQDDHPALMAYIEAVMFVESKGDPTVVSPSNALGLMQVKTNALPIKDKPTVYAAYQHLLTVAGEDQDARGVADGLAVMVGKSNTMNNLLDTRYNAYLRDRHEIIKENLYLFTLGYKAGTEAMKGFTEDLKTVDIEYPPRVAAYLAYRASQFPPDSEEHNAYQTVIDNLVEGAGRLGQNEEEREQLKLAFGRQQFDALMHYLSQNDFSVAQCQDSSPAVLAEASGHGLPDGTIKPKGSAGVTP